MKDLNHIWKTEGSNEFLSEYLYKARKEGVLPEVEDLTIMRWFNLAGLQRQLRILGTLSRLHLGDNKSYRLVDLKQTLVYMIDATSNYKDLSELNIFLKKKILPALDLKLRDIP